MRFTPWVAAAVLVAAACAPKPETPEQAAARMAAETDSARAAIDAFNAQFIAALAAGRLDSIEQYFTPDAVAMWPNEPAITGPAAIRAKLAGMLEIGTWQWNVSTQRVEVSGPLAVEIGTNVISFTPGPNAPRGMAAMYPDTVKYVTVWRKVEGRWLVAADIGNSNKAMR